MGLFLEVALRAVGSTWKSGGLCLCGEQCLLSWWQRYAKNRPKHQKLETAGVQKVPCAWKSLLCVKIQDLQLVDLCSGQNSTILSQKKFYTSLRNGLFSSSVCSCLSLSSSLPGLTSYYLLKIKGNTEAVMKKWLKVLLVAQGLFV